MATAIYGLYFAETYSVSVEQQRANRKDLAETVTAD